MRHAAWIGVLATMGGPAWAQAPSISELFPAGARAGTQISATLSGKDLKSVTLLGLPAGVQASSLTIKGTQSGGKIALTIPANAKAGTIPVVVQGTAKNVVVAAPAVMLTIQPAK